MKISERDWKVFKKVREAALERFCESAVADLAAVCSDGTRSVCDRYRAAGELMHKRDREMADAFDDLRRLTAIPQLVLMHTRGLVSAGDMKLFSPEVQAIIAKIRGTLASSDS